jgi:hypothetical protein
MYIFSKYNQNQFCLGVGGTIRFNDSKAEILSLFTNLYLIEEALKV